MLSKTRARPRCWKEVRRGGCGFDDGAGRGEVAAQHSDAAFVQQGLASKPDHIGVPDGSGVQVVDEWTPSHRGGRRVEQIPHLPQNRAARRHGRSHP
jgi:hypothetical protein